MEQPLPRRNLELKVRSHDIAVVREVVRELCGNDGDVELQTDTYFPVPNGRLKLREIQDRPCILIGYQRPDHPAIRGSDYHLVPVIDPELMKAALSGALGVRGVVSKRREIYHWHNVRIHLDDVDNLGKFIELEAVLGPDTDEVVSRKRLDEVVKRLGLDPVSSIAGSYSDLLGL